MKLRNKIFVIIVVLLSSLYSSSYIFMFVRGRSLILAKLRELTGREVSMGYFTITPPFNLEIRNLNIEGLAKIESILVSPSVSQLVVGRLALNKIRLVRPEITYERVVPAAEAAAAETSGKEAAVKPPRALMEIGAVPEITLSLQQNGPMKMMLKRIAVKDGIIHFVDHSVGPAGIRITVKDLNFRLVNVYTFPFSDVTNFKLEARIPWEEGREEGKVEVKGWLNFAKKDMQATLKIKDIDGVYLYPYYSNWVDLEKARIESARLNFSSDIQGLDNNITAECHLELTDIVRKEHQAEEPHEKAEKITDAVLDMFKSMDSGKIVLDFTIRTRMDKPRFAFACIKDAFEDKLAMARGGGFRPEGVFFLPGKFLEGTVKGATGFSKALIEGTFTLGKEIKKGVEDSFRRELPPAKYKYRREEAEEGESSIAADKDYSIK
ncbi:MAG: DUF748 domain-containing protein [Candidatus Omnitrophica bacterium]|nr:DUF748 domain-containing protein [Candidatus Omnitrophota bacterium]